MISIIKSHFARFTHKFILMCCFFFACCAVCLPHNTKCHSIPILFCCLSASVDIYLYSPFFSFSILWLFNRNEITHIRIYIFIYIKVYIIIIWVLVKRHLQWLKKMLWNYLYALQTGNRVNVHIECACVRVRTHAYSNEIEVLVYLFSVFCSLFLSLSRSLSHSPWMCNTLAFVSYKYIVNDRVHAWSCSHRIKQNVWLF